MTTTEHAKALRMAQKLCAERHTWIMGSCQQCERIGHAMVRMSTDRKT